MPSLVLMLRFAVGWQGRRAMIGTICGFVCTALVLAGYAVRATGGARMNGDLFVVGNFTMWRPWMSAKG